MCKCMKLWVFLALSLSFGIARGSRWSETGKLNVARHGASGAALTDGRVMLLGGQGGKDVCEIFDPAGGTWKQSVLPVGSDHRMAILLYNGEVLYIPKEYSKGWLYDPYTGNWNASSASFALGLRCHATLLKDGRVLLQAEDEKNYQLYNYLPGEAVTWTGANHATFGYRTITEVLLPSGEVLVCGDFWETDCELYDPIFGKWEYTDSLHNSRDSPVAMLLPPPWQEVLIAGGRWGAGKKSELYNPISKKWRYTTGDLTYPVRKVPGMVLLPSGKALIVGGENGFGVHNQTCELYDPEEETWSVADAPQYDRSHFILALLYTGKALAAGSWTGGKECEIYDPSDGAWDATKPSLNVERACHTVTPLPIIHIHGICSTNVLIAGGENSEGALKSCELYNYCKERVTITDSLNEARSHHTAILLPSASGEVLVAGGKNASGALKSCELYNASTGNWTSTGSLPSIRFDHAATLLKDGSVLTTGGQRDAVTYIGGCEIYSGGVWTNIVDCNSRARHTAVLLLDGRVLVIGGQTIGGTPICQVWDGVTWTATGNLTTARYLHTATLLQSGKVLVIGGKDAGGAPLLSCEIFDPDSNKWFPEGNLNQTRYAHNTTLLYSGLVLVTGGNSGSNSCEIWDPAAEWDSLTNTHEWKVTASLATGRAYHSSVLITDTMPFILAIGGKDGTYLNSIEEYDVGLGYRSEWQSTITSHKPVTLVSPSMDIEGTLFRGVSEADGGNYCHIVSNDHPIISLVRIGGGNWQGNGGGEILHMPLSSSWDETHTTVHPEVTDFQGYYRLWSIVNGIPCKWYKDCALGAEEKTGTNHKATGISVVVSPNPSTAGVRFQVSGLSTLNSELLTLSVYDCAGRLMRSQKSEVRSQKSEVIRLDGLKAGIYFYRIEYGDSENKGKFIITR